MRTVYPVIMSGGSGTRLWPLSRQNAPKQYQRLITDATMLEETLLRVTPDVADIDIAAPTIICASGHQDQILEQAANVQIELNTIILEPIARNTAAVAAVAARHVATQDADGLVLLLPADHHVADRDAFWQAVQEGIVSAQGRYLVTLGIQPTAPETGYGYIEKGTPLSEKSFKVARFVEKPDLVTAQSYIADGNFFWNAGIFLYGADAMLKEFTALQPIILEHSLKAYENAVRTDKTIALCKDSFSRCPSDSIDYAIMEKTERAAIVAPVSVGWNDIGAWLAVSGVGATDGAPQHVGDVISIDSDTSYIRSSGPLVATIGVEDLIIVVEEDAILITHKDRSQDVKKIVTQLKESGRDDLL